MTDRTSSPEKLVSSLPGERAIVLLVDDQPLVAKAIRRMLGEDPDVQFHYCADPREAVATANDIQPTAILQDLIMPQVAGLEMVRRFRANAPTRDTPIIVLSSVEEAQTKSDAFAAGANDYLVKLPDALEFLARIRYHSRTRILQLQRDEAFRALRESQEKLIEKNAELVASNRKLEQALAEVRQLQGLLPICSYCHKVRDDRNYWQRIESFFLENSDLRFSHGICPDCYEKLLKDLDAEVPAKAEAS
jgi:PleD family two-component response regulator